jgi:hypothetical protein
VYQGLLGIRTTVELKGAFSKTGTNRKDVRFKTAQVRGAASLRLSSLHPVLTPTRVAANTPPLPPHPPDRTPRNSTPTPQVDFGGFKVVFPHMDLFGVSGWLETTFVDEHIRICRGNRGSIFVLTRRPLAPSGV